ncbi:hypothetical protein [Lacrimispora defluvii]|uniref:Uncharacterized protein n=1 Tax=Lacrimispora defluvii TaxID=2719233 RepID=A0ABX1VT77_9FIRM|nr:hypothetical protein [Lacrimispora defluvii]NNJ29506.1 hypothetical protein [Lacrimispora defluvii]
MRKLIIAALVILLLSGCSAQDSSAITISQEPVVSKSAVLSEVADGIDTSKIQGKIRNIFCAAQNQVLILADKLYIYDLVTNSILYNTDMVNFSESEFYTIDKGIAAIGTINGDNSNGLSVNSQKDNILIVLYDNSLEKTAEINSSMFVAENEFIASSQQVAVSDDGKNIAFATNLGLYIYNIHTKTKTTLIDLSDDNDEKRCGLAWIDKVAFVKSGSTLAFMAQSFDVPVINGKDAYNTYGTINIDGSNLSLSERKDYTVKQFLAYNDFILMADGFKAPSGKLLKLDLSTMKLDTFSTKTQKESGSIFGSEKGQYFATSVVNKDNVTVRVYSMNTGLMLMEKVIVKEAFYMEREPEIRIIDDLKTCIVILGNRQRDVSTLCLFYPLNE